MNYEGKKEIYNSIYDGERTLEIYKDESTNMYSCRITYPKFKEEHIMNWVSYENISVTVGFQPFLEEEFFDYKLLRKIIRTAITEWEEKNKPKEINNKELDDRIKQAKLIVAKTTLATGKNKQFIEQSADKDGACRILGMEPEIYNQIKEEDEDNFYDYSLKQYLELVKDKKYSEASEMLVNRILNKFYIYTTKDDTKTEVWIYKDGIYVPQGKSEIKEYLREFLGKFYSQFVFNLIMNKIEPDTFIDIDNFFNQNYIDEVPVLNGILNINTRELKPFSSDKIFFCKIPVEYIPTADCPMIDKFLSDTLSNQEDRKVFYELGGFILLKEYKYEKAFIFVGDGRNGKDKSIELLKRVFGMDNCCSVPLSSLVPDSFIISEFFGKMLNVAGEVNNQDLKDTSMFKALTGRSIVSGQRKFLRPITFQNYAKFVFACNELPMVYDNSKGFWSRWVVLEYPYTFLPEKEMDATKDKIKLRDPDIIEKITTPTELSGLLNKFLDGLDRLKIQKDFSTTRGSEEIKNLWIRKSNSFMAFCLDSIEDDYDSWITKKDLRKKYIKYCKLHKISPKSDFIIKKTLNEMFGTSDDRKDIGFNVWEWSWTGIKWRDKEKL